MNAPDPTETDERVRVLDFRDTPGAKTKPHGHPNSVLLILSDFQRRLTMGTDVREITVKDGQAVWSSAHIHTGENIGTTDTHVVFVELKD